MSVPCVAVERERGEAVRERLADADILDGDHEIAVDGDTIYIPVAGPRGRSPPTSRRRSSSATPPSGTARRHQPRSSATNPRWSGSATSSSSTRTTTSAPARSPTR